MHGSVYFRRSVLIRLHLFLNFSYEVVLTLDKEKHKVDGPIYYYVFNSLLFSLLVLHIYWWVLMYRMLVKQIQSRGHVGDDIRSGRFSFSLDSLVIIWGWNWIKHSLELNYGYSWIYHQLLVFQPCMYVLGLMHYLSLAKRLTRTIRIRFIYVS